MNKVRHMAITFHFICLPCPCSPFSSSFFLFLLFLHRLRGAGDLDFVAQAAALDVRCHQAAHVLQGQTDHVGAALGKDCELARDGHTGGNTRERDATSQLGCGPGTRQTKKKRKKKKQEVGGSGGGDDDESPITKKEMQENYAHWSCRVKTVVSRLSKLVMEKVPILEDPFSVGVVFEGTEKRMEKQNLEENKKKIRRRNKK
jgi:hypothetical protein